MFYLLLPTLTMRDALIAHLKSRGILSVFHYVPLHNSEMGLRVGSGLDECREAVTASERLVRLPFYNDLTEEDQAEVIEAIRSFAGG